jgi:hydroxycarboxylate dehydrogenase B
LRQSHHLGRVGHWAEQAVAAGLIAIHFTNSVSRPNVAPWGGAQGRFNTNPFTVGIPVPGREPWVLDFATSAIAQGKVRVAFNKGVAVPPGSLLDAQGEPTDDPSVLFPKEGEAMGALLTMASHKGHALALVCEVLGAALTGGPTSRPETMAIKHGVWNSMLTIVLDPQRLNTAEHFNAEVKAFVEWLQSSALRPGHDAVLLPGDAERRYRRQRAQQLPIDDGTLAELDEAAAAVNRARGTALAPLSALSR